MNLRDMTNSELVALRDAVAAECDRRIAELVVAAKRTGVKNAGCQKYRIYAESDVLHMRKLAASGVTLSQAAAEMQAPVASICQIAQRNGIEFAKDPRGRKKKWGN
jgi:hypothetical protein